MHRSLDQRDKVALQVALALLDDVQDDYMDWINSHESPDTSAGDEDDSLTDKPVRKRKRTRRKDEIAALRSTVEKLEDEIIATTKRIADAQNRDPRELELVSIWAELASCQQSKRQSVEAENARLRQMLQSQITKAKELMRFLEREPREEDIPGANSLKRVQITAVDSVDIHYDDIVNRLDALYSQAPAVFNPETSWVSRRNVREMCASYPELRCVVVEMKFSWVVPFSQEAVTQAFRHHLVRYETRCNNFEMLPEKDRVVVTLFGRPAGSSSDTGVENPSHLVSRYYPDETSALIVSELSLGPGVCSLQFAPGYSVTSEAWIRISPYRPNGVVLQSSTTQNLTHIQTLRRVKFTNPSTSAPTPKKDSSLFVQRVLDHFSAHFDESQEIVEDLIVQGIQDDVSSREDSSSSTAPSSPRFRNLSPTREN